MTIFEYLKLAIRHKYLILVVLIAALITGSLIANNNQKLNVNNTVFYIFGIQDPNQQTNSYENLQAADQITESIQGWFKDPSFLSEINRQSNLSFAIKSKKQEKNNLVLTYNSDNNSNGDIFSQTISRVLQQRINNYNANSDLQIKISSQLPHSSEKASDLGLYLLISLIAGLLTGYLSAYFYEYFTGKVKSKTEIKHIMKRRPVFTFTNHKQLKTKYHFLVKFLQNNFVQEKLQILDLTSKSKIGLEVISKHTNFQEVKSFDIPVDLSGVNLDVPTLILVELGHSKQNNLKQLVALKFTHLELILLDQI